MLSLLKTLFSFLFQNKRTLFLILFLTVFFFILRFPLNEWLGKNISELQKKSPLSRDIVFDNLKIKWLPPGLLFEDVSFVYQNKRSHLDSALVSLSLKHWIAFKRAFNFKLKQAESSLFINFYRKLVSEEPPETTAQEIYFVKGYSRFINLKDLGFLYPNMSGELNTKFSYQGSFQETETITGELFLNGRNIKLSELQLSTILGPLNLPSIEWSEVELKLKVKEGELLFEKVELGEEKDELRIKMRGSGAFNYFRRVRLNSYNIELQIDIDKNRQFGFLDLIFANYKEEKSDFYRYSVRLIGRGSQVPKIEKLENF